MLFSRLFGLVLVSCFSVSAFATPTARLTSGSTTLVLNAQFTQAVKSLGVGTSLVTPGRQRSGQINFPIRTGQLDTQTLRGEILHEGGLRLSNGAVAVDLLNFVVDTTGPAVILSGLVRFNNSVIGRVPLFTVTIAQAQVAPSSRFLNLSNAAISLHPQAAAALNEFFSTSAFTPGFASGTVSLTSRLNYSFPTRSIR